MRNQPVFRAQESQTMKPTATVLLTLASLLLNATTANACCLWPFCGWGYSANYPAAYPVATPAWNSYSTYYTPWYPAPSAWNICCPTACCNPCDNCSIGNCATPANQASPATSGSLKPKSDPQFQDRRNSPAPNTSPNNRTLPPVDQLNQPANTEPEPAPTDTFSPPPRRQPANPTQPTDSFNSPQTNPADSTEPSPFDSNDSISNKPPVSDPAEPNLPQPADNNSTPPVDSFSTDPVEKSPAENPQSRRSSPTSPNHSRVAELAPHKRLANTTRSNHPANTKAADIPHRVRWISAPTPANHARL